MKDKIKIVHYEANTKTKTSKLKKAYRLSDAYNIYSA